MRITLRNASKFFLVLPIFASLALASDAPWKGKPYQQWDDKDLQRIFTDSAWARKATITRTWAAPTQKEPPNNPQLSGAGRRTPSSGSANES
jgi:hypothetical protein